MRHIVCLMDYPLQTPSQLSLHLRDLRQSKGWSQAQLGQRLGVGQSRVARIERDPTAISVAQLCQVLAVLGVQLVLRPTGEGAAAASDAEW